MVIEQINQVRKAASYVMPFYIKMQYSIQIYSSFSAEADLSEENKEVNRWENGFDKKEINGQFKRSDLSSQDHLFLLD